MSKKTERLAFGVITSCLLILLLICSLSKPKAVPVFEDQGPISFDYVLEPPPLKPDGIILFFAKSDFGEASVSNLLKDFFHQKLRQAIIRQANRRNFQVATFGLNSDNGLQEADRVKRVIEGEQTLNRLPIKGIILTPIDSFAYNSVIYANTPSGERMPIVTVDTPLELDEQGLDRIVGHVTIDNEEVARRVAFHVLSEAKETGTLDGDIILLMGPAIQQNSNDRLRGFSEAINQIEEETGSRLRVSVIANGNWSTDFGREAMNWYRKLRPINQLAAVISANDNMAFGAAIELSNRGNSLPLISGIDGNRSALQAIQRGLITATIAQPADALGMVAVNTLLDFTEEGIEPEVKLITVQSQDVITDGKS